MENFNQIVNSWYLKLRKDFINTIMSRYSKSGLKIEDVENIYQNVFIAINDNLNAGKISENTSWKSYIMKVGLNMAGRFYKQNELISSLNTNLFYSSENDELSGHQYKEWITENTCEESAYHIEKMEENLKYEISRLSKNHARIMMMHYAFNMKDADIARKLKEYKNADTVKTIRHRCLRDLRNKMELRRKEMLIA